MTFKRHLNKPHLNMLHIKKFDYEMSPRQRIVMYHHVTYYIPSIWYLLKCHLVNITYNCIIPICRITLDDKSTNSSPSQCKMSNCNDVNSVESSLMTFYKLIAYEYFDYVGGRSLGFGWTTLNLCVIYVLMVFFFFLYM